MNYKILVADDYDSNLAVIESIFEKSGQEYDAIYAHDGLEACEKAIRHSPDLIIMDWEMPKMTGIEAVKYLKGREDTRHIPIIMTTAFTSSEHLEKALETGATDYVRKPIDEVELLARVNSALQIVSSYKKILQQKEEIEEKSQELEFALREIEKKNENIMSSIKYAKRIQDAMLPQVIQLQNFIPDLFILFRPRDVVSGDFYWFTERNNYMMLAAVDCTGHGVPGAFMSMLGETYLNQIVNIMGQTDPGEILNTLHHSIKSALKQDRTENRDGMDASLVVLNPERNKIKFAGARNPLVYINKNELEVIKGNKYSIGGKDDLREGIKDFETHEIALPEAQTTFYIYSDGYQDQFSINMQSKFMAKRYRKLLKKIHKYPMPEQLKILEHILEDWMRGTKQVDDILIIGFRVN